MSYAMITITTKPADTVWFNIANPGAAARLNTLVRAMPGFITASTQRVAPNTMQNIVIFDTKEHLDALVALMATDADFVAKEAYKTAHGQSSTVSYS